MVVDTSWDTLYSGHFLGHFGAPRKTFQPPLSLMRVLYSMKAFPTKLSRTEVSVNTFCSLYSQLCHNFLDFFTSSACYWLWQELFSRWGRGTHFSMQLIPTVTRRCYYSIKPSCNSSQYKASQHINATIIKLKCRSEPTSQDVLV